MEEKLLTNIVVFFSSRIELWYTSYALVFFLHFFPPLSASLTPLSPSISMIKSLKSHAFKLSQSLSHSFLLSSDIRSEGSIAIVKIFDFDFLVIFHSTSLPESKNVFQKKCVCVCVSVCPCERRRTQSLNQLTDLVQIQYIQGPDVNISSRFLVFPYPKIKGSSHKKKI